MSKPTVLLVGLAFFIAMIVFFYAGSKELEMTTKIQSGYYVAVGGLNGSLLMHKRRNVSLYSQRLVKERRARAAIGHAKNRIYTHWAVRQYPLFLSTVHIPVQSWSVFKYRFLKLIVDHEMKNASRLVIGFVGTSVSLGLSTHPEESFPSLTERTLRPLFDALQMNLEVF